MEAIRTLQEFYTLMHETRSIRYKATAQLLVGTHPDESVVAHLQKALTLLQQLPVSDGMHQVLLDREKSMAIDLDYEIEELKRDIYYLTHSEEEFFDYLRAFHEGFDDAVGRVRAYIGETHFSSFITDRDGTVNNYCGRYGSSVQSIYNAVFLARFAQAKTDAAVILTSAPLADIGLVDISVMPEKYYLYAASKGREYINAAGTRCMYPIAAEKQQKLDVLNARLGEMVKEPSYEKFSLIGSGLQYKFGQTTVARQDIAGTIPEAESEAFLSTVSALVAEIDPDKAFFRIEDTGKDIEIILTIDADSGAAKDFDKGDGVLFLDDDVPLRMNAGTALICGDTGSDVPMIPAAQQRAPKTLSVFVTHDEALQKKVMEACPGAVCVPYPDALVVGLYSSIT